MFSNASITLKKTQTLELLKEALTNEKTAGRVKKVLNELIYPTLDPNIHKLGDACKIQQVNEDLSLVVSIYTKPVKNMKKSEVTEPKSEISPS
jgi:hypothetical protein